MPPFRILSFAAFLTCFLLTSTAHAKDARFRLSDGDRVVLLGDGLIEQEQYFGWIEVMLTTSFPDADATFRNLGWNGDTPAGDSRFGLSLLQAGREPAGEGWRQLQKQLELTDPNVVVFGYGMASALQAAQSNDPESERSSFEANFERLIREIRGRSPDAKLVFLSPLQPVGASTLSSEWTSRFVETIQRLAKQHAGYFVDLTSVADSPDQRKDAVHLNAEGYRSVADAVHASLDLPSSDWRTNRYTESLREVILEKNRWWFNRSRPANMAYVFGFRKHEQGQNAVEIPQYDELIAADEARIARLRNLRPSAFPTPTKRTSSRYAEFTAQPHPDFTVADGLTVTLWAENPMLNKPIQMNFDPDGRLWVASSEAYPMIEVGQSAPDKIVVLEDTNGDGTADKSEVFADGLLIPTGVLPGDGGVYVAQSTDLLFLRDTDGDGRADERTRVLSGFGTEDTHHNLHTLRWGMDGRLYMNQSVYTRTDTETPYGVVRMKAGGGFRYATQKGHLQAFFRGLWNSWGHQFDRHGNSFMTDGAGFAGIAYVFPGATFNPVPGARQVLDLISPGKYPKFCSTEIVYGDAYPDDWQGSIVTCDFRANRVTRFRLSEQDSGFVTEQADDLIRTSQSSFRPIDVKQGPDGAIYVADWSNPIINHGEVDFRDPRRDRWHGRIWRIAPADLTPKKSDRLSEMKTIDLLNRLTSNDRFQVDQSRRVLTERGAEILPALTTWLASQTEDAARLQGLWLCQSVENVNMDLLTQLLTSENADVRAATVRVLADWSDASLPMEDTLAPEVSHELLSARIHDSHPRVRLEAVRALARHDSPIASRLALEVVDHPMDRFLAHALFLMVNQQADALMNQLGQPVASNQKPVSPAALEFVLTSLPAANSAQFLKDYLDKNQIPRSGEGPWIELVAKAGDRGQLNQLYRQALEDGFDDSGVARVLSALADSQRKRKMRPELGPKPGLTLKPLIESKSSAVRLSAIELTGAWKIGGMTTQLAKIAGSTNTPRPERLAAIEALRSIGGNATTKLVSLSNSEHATEIRMAAVTALAGSATQAAVTPFFELIADVQDEATAVSLWRTMLSGKDSQALLVKSLPSELSRLAARSGVRAAQEGGRNAQSLVDALMPMTGLSMTAADWSPERIGEITKLVQSQGDPLNGEMIYRREQLQCATCHAIGGVGGKVGPDMTSLGASAPIDYLIESLYDPNAKIKENYHSVMVLTESGQVLTGIEIESTDDEVVLRDAAGKIIRISQDDVTAKKPGKSLMPAGLLDRIAQKDQVDLIAFLTQLGKPGPFDASRQNVARSVEVLPGTHRLEQQGTNAVITGGPLPTGRAAVQWKPLQPRLSGEISRSVLQKSTAQPVHISLVNVYLRTTVQASSQTDAMFEIEGAETAACWIDGQPVPSQKAENRFQSSLSPGEHTLLIRLDARALPEMIKIRSDDVAFIAK